MASIQAPRKLGRVSRNQLAERAGIGRFKVWQFETGRSDATPAEELRLRQALLELLREHAVKVYRLLTSNGKRRCRLISSSRSTCYLRGVSNDRR